MKQQFQFSMTRFREEERQRRAAVVTEFGGDADAMAGEISAVGIDRKQAAWLPAPTAATSHQPG